MSDRIFKTDRDVEKHFQKVRQKIKSKKKEKKLLKEMKFHRILEAKKF